MTIPWILDIDNLSSPPLLQGPLNLIMYLSMQRARKRSNQNKAWQRVRILAGPILAVVKALGNVPMAKLIVSKTFSESRDKYHVLELLVSVTLPSTRSPVWT